MTNFTQNQILAVNTLDTSVSVSAGAGSGKTRVLVERYVNILDDALKKNIALSARNILCITFTKKAAAEMKERIRKRLSEKEKEGTSKDFWIKQKNTFDQARISTIHGLCSSLLRENPVEANLDPSFKVAEETEMQDFIQSTVYEFVKAELAKGNSSATLLAASYGGEKLVEHLIYLLNDVEDILNAGDLKTAYYQNYKHKDIYSFELVACVDDLIRVIPDVTAKKHKEELKRLERGYSDVIKAITNFDKAEDLEVLKFYLGGLSATAKQDKIIVQEVKELLKKLETVLIDREALNYIAAWVEVLNDCCDNLRTKQEQLNLLGFDDLERMTLKLLENNPELCVKYQNIFKYIMVDEFQDTNNRQKEIIYLLCGGDKEKLKANNLFIVGDPKQSIYRFRGADVSVFSDVRKEIEQNKGKSIVLNDNFRTVDKILDVCNKVFRDFLGEDKTKSVYFEELVANRKSEFIPELVIVQGDKDTNQYKRQTEARRLAEKVRNLHDVEKIPYKDIVFLLSALTHAQVYADELAVQGIPVQVLDAKGFYEKQEILDLTNLLKFCSDNSNILELAGVLRSPFFALSDETITKLFLIGAKENQNLWSIMQNDLNDDGFSDIERAHIKHCKDILNRLKTSAIFMPLNEFASVMMDVLHIETVLSAQDSGKDKIANVKAYIDAINSFTAEKHASLNDWLANVSMMRDMQARVNVLTDAGNADCVKIMTVHKSKGLEFPVVILPALDGSGANDHSDVYFTKNQGLGIKALWQDKLSETSVYKAIKEQEKELDEEEKSRLFYVAMTRAQDRLIMSGAIKTDRAENNKFRRLCLILDGCDELVTTEFIDAAPINVIEKSEKIQIDKPLVIGEDIPEQTEALPMYGKSWQRNCSATALQKYERCERSYYYSYVMQMPGIEPDIHDGEVAVDPLTLGSVIHEALEIYSGDVVAALKPVAYKFNLTDAGYNEAKALLENYVKSDIYLELQKQRQEHEVEFNLPLLQEYGIDATWHGFIDCLVFNDDGNVRIVDYKTGTPPKEGEAETGYKYQLALYKAAVEKMYNTKVTSAELHYLKDCSVYRLNGEYLPEIAQKVLEIFAKAEESEFACQTSGCKYCPYDYFCKRD